MGIPDMCLPGASDTQKIERQKMEVQDTCNQHQDLGCVESFLTLNLNTLLLDF